MKINDHRRSFNWFNLFIMAKKKALGRGLGALIDDAEREKLEEKVEANLEISIDDIELNPFQPRTRFDETALDELASSIGKLGVVQPLTVRESEEDNKYQLIAGERRLKAARKAGLKTVPAYVRTADDQAMLELALVENIQREDLDSIEIAISYQRLIEECQLTQEKLSGRVGKQRSTVTNYLRLLKLPAEIQLGIRDKQLTMGHARTLISIEDEKQQIKVYYRIIDEGLSVRKTEEIVRKLQINDLKDPDKNKKKDQLNKDYEDLSGHLSKILKSDVQFRINDKGKGKIVIPFNNTDQMEDILGILDKLNS